MVKEMHLQENTLFDLDLGVKVTQNVAQFQCRELESFSNFQGRW